MLGAIYPFNIISEDSLRFFIKDYDAEGFFDRFNFTYFVLINKDIVSPDYDAKILDTDIWDSNANLEIIYHNSLGEEFTNIVDEIYFMKIMLISNCLPPSGGSEDVA